MSNSSSPISPPAVRGALLELMRRLHFYIGFFVAPFIFVAALTGTLYILSPQIEKLIYADILITEQQGMARPLSEQIIVARQYIGEEKKIHSVRPAPSVTETTRVQFIDPTVGESETRAIFVDPYTLQIKGDKPVYGTSGSLPLRTWLSYLHLGLLLGDIGCNYSELAASWLWVAALGGVVLWQATRPRRKIKKISKGFAATRRWHSTLGLILLIGLLFFSATGLTWSQWAGSNIDKMRSEFGWLTPQVNTLLNRVTPEAVADPHAEHRGSMPEMEMPDIAKPVNSLSADWDQVLNTARSAGLKAGKIELRQPKEEGRAWAVAEIDRSWPTQVDAVSVDPENFTVVDHIRFEQFPLLAKLTRWGVDAHMGILFGLPNQLLLAAFGIGLCTMIGLGYRMWWLRRPAIAVTAPVQTLLGAWRKLPVQGKILSGLTALVFGYALPLMGISLLIFLLIDVLREKCQKA